MQSTRRDSVCGGSDEAVWFRVSRLMFRAPPGRAVADQSLPSAPLMPSVRRSCDATLFAASRKQGSLCT